MDLRTWIIAEHASVPARFSSSIAATVPLQSWAERADGGGSSIAFLVLHTAWHEDLAITTALRGSAPLLERWRERLGLGGCPPHTGLAEAEPVDVAERLALDELGRYAAAVHDHTAAWLADIDLAMLDDVPPAGERIASLAGVTEDAVPWLHRMWDGKPGSFFVQWEAIGHPLNHLGEMVSVRGRLGLSPF